MNMKLKIEIPLLCRPKKNSQSIIYNSKTKKPMIVQSKQYKEFERECLPYLIEYKLKINTPINLKCIFKVNEKRRRDLCNLLNAIQDVLVKYDVLDDDNYNIVKSVDGSRIIYSKNEEPKIVIEITDYKE